MSRSVASLAANKDILFALLCLRKPTLRAGGTTDSTDEPRLVWIQGLTRSTAAEISNMDLSNVQRIVKLYRDGGFEALLKSNRTYVPTSELAQFEEVIRNSLEQQPARTIAEACARIKELTGLERGPTQVRKFLKSIGLKWQRVRAIPVPPKKVWLST